MNLEDQIPGMETVTDAKTLLKNLVGAFMVLAISLATVGILLVPDIREQSAPIVLTRDLSEWVATIGSLLLVTFLLAFPVYLILQGVVYYRNARALDRNVS